MRIAVVNWTPRQLGGAEKYLSSVLPALASRGHELAFLAEMDQPQDRERVSMPHGTPLWTISEHGQGGALDRLAAWSPDLVFTHITHSPAVEAGAQQIAPAVFFAHAYYGTCVSGTKTHKFPAPVPCQRSFGPACLLHFYPRRCGGLSPLTMIRDYRRQDERRRLLSNYRAILTNSRHMGEEYVRNGFDAASVFPLPMPVAATWKEGLVPPRGQPGSGLNLLFAGRMDPLKGGTVAMDALTHVAQRLGREVRLVMVGDGPERENWMRHARSVQQRCRGVSIDFPGWLGAGELRGWFSAADLLVVPSLWPEPFGLIGPEAGLHRLPAAAFPVGGIPEWLVDGVGGHLAQGEKHGPEELAEAIIRCIEDPVHQESLRQGAQRTARGFSIAAHVDLLDELLRNASNSQPRNSFTSLDPRPA